MVMGKIGNMMISRNLDTNVRIKVYDTFVKEVDRNIYLGSVIYSKWNIGDEVSRQMQNSSKS
jgi:hypothetical protein